MNVTRTLAPKGREAMVRSLVEDGLFNEVDPGTLPMIGPKAMNIEPSLRQRRLTSMDRDREKQEIEEKLARCKQLAKEYVREPTATHIRELEKDLLAQLGRMERQ
jgi:hypothetical protein